MKNKINLLGQTLLVLALVAFGFNANVAQAATFTLADVAAHSTAADCWTVVNNNVYNLTSYISQHPGGVATITQMCGIDGTTVLNNSGHGSQVLSVVASDIIGTLTDAHVLTSVTVTPNPSSVEVGAMTQLIAAPLDENGTAFVGATTTFASSDATVATVDNTGMVTGVAAGTATVTATSVSGSVTVTGTSIVTVTPVVVTPVLTSVTVTPATSSIATGDTAQLTAAPMDQNGTAFVGATTTFTSSDVNVATVDNAGMVTAVAPGTATITASSVSGTVTVTGTATVTVAAPVLTSVNVTPATPSVDVGGTLPVVAAPLNQDGKPFVGATTTFASSDTAVATVDNTGMVTGVADGTSTITATAVSGDVTVTGTTVVTVGPATVTPVLTSVTVTPATPSVAVGGTTQLTAAPLDETGAAFVGATTTFASSDTTIATVDAGTGMVTGVAAGTATITATSVSGTTTVSDTATVTVTAVTGGGSTLPNISGITAPTVIKTGQVGTWKVNASDPQNGTLTYAVDWGDTAGIRRAALAPIFVQTATFTHAYSVVGTYTVTFTVSSAAGTSAVSTITVHVVQGSTTTPTLTSVVVTPATSSITTGGTAQLTASPLDQNGTAFVGATTTFSSSDESVATVNAETGMVTGVADGTATITATSVSGTTTVTGTATVTVTPAIVPVLTSVVVTPATSSVTVTGTQQITGVPMDQNGAVFVGATTTYSSSDDTIATVDNTGKVTGVNFGTATITATSVSGSVTVTGTATVTVATTPVITSLDGPKTIATGQTETVTVNALDPQDGNLTYAADWGDSATTLRAMAFAGTPFVQTATFSHVYSVAGTYTAKFTVMNDAGEIASSSMVIVATGPITLSSVSVTPGTASVAIGATRQLTAAPMDQNGAAFVGATTTYSSSDTTIATVDSTGKVTGVAAGTTTITATSVSGDVTVTGTSSVTVNVTGSDDVVGGRRSAISSAAKIVKAKVARTRAHKAVKAATTAKKGN
ncbi:Ig-like domain-containing protein [Candidatus Nomurabacteria bacterium]|nr:Ig-like domain-containing protein [Candidatus Nomurabacteria bacterium]